jgi:regulator of cell morphogenesis and NO signaling
MLPLCRILVAREQAVAEIVLEHPRCAGVFVERGIDFCCRGAMSLGDACAARGIEEDTLLAELEAVIAAGGRGNGAPDPRSLSNLQLIAHIVDQHHVYLRKTLPLVELLAARVADAHAQRQPSLSALHAALRDLRALLESHLQREETVVFPLLVGGERPRQRMRRELAWMQTEHLQVGEALRQLRLLADSFLPPPWACTSYRALMTELETMERDTFEHVHLENNVLAPRFAASPRSG